MKKLFFLLSIIFLGLAAKAGTVTIGTGSGTLIKNDMTGFNSVNDTLYLNAGTYSGGGQFSGYTGNNLVVINKGGVVTFKATVDWGNGGNMKNYHFTGTGVSGTFYGFVFDATGTFGVGPLGFTTGDAFFFTALNTQSCSFDHFSFQSIPSNAFDCGHDPILYNGTVGSFKMYKMTFHDCRLDNSTQFYQGDFGSPEETNNENLCDSVDMHNIIVTQIQSPGSIVNAGPMTHCNFYNWNITYVGYNTQSGDVGAFYVIGNGQFHHNFMHGGRGYLARVFGCSLKPAVDGVWCYDNVILATTNYAGFDMRSDSGPNGGWGEANPYLGHANIHIIFNTVGNKGNDEGYVSPVVVEGDLSDGATAEARNNLAFNLNTPNLPQAGIVVTFTAGWPTSADTSNNRYYTASNILNFLLDTVTACAVKSGSSLIGAGVANAQVTTDFSYRTRPSPPSIGAEEFSAATSPPALTAATGATVDNNFSITFTDDAVWRGAITSVQIGGVALPSAAWSTSAGVLTLKPSQSSLLQTNGNKTVTVVSTGYSNDVVTQAIGVGVPAKLSMNTQPTAPATNGAVLATQPKVNLLDQYGNQTTATSTITATVGSGVWTIGGTVSVAAVSGVATFTNLTGSSSGTVTATITFTGSGITSITSNAFNIPAVGGCPNCLVFDRGKIVFQGR